eukprot:9836547-Lingulodinium_polyedra.AAC.1
MVGSQPAVAQRCVGWQVGGAKIPKRHRGAIGRRKFVPREDVFFADMVVRQVRNGGQAGWIVAFYGTD